MTKREVKGGQEAAEQCESWWKQSARRFFHCFLKIFSQRACKVEIHRAIVSDSVDATQKQPGAAEVARV